MNPPLSIKLQNKYFNIAKNVSSMSDFKQHHLGCVIVYKNKIISDGYNSTKTNPLQKALNKERNFDKIAPNDGQLHSEIHALIRAKDVDVDWGKVSLFTYREHANGIRGYSRPCPACMKAIKDKGIKNIYYCTEDGFAYERIE